MHFCVIVHASIRFVSLVIWSRYLLMSSKERTTSEVLLNNIKMLLASANSKHQLLKFTSSSNYHLYEKFKKYICIYMYRYVQEFSETLFINTALFSSCRSLPRTT